MCGLLLVSLDFIRTAERTIYKLKSCAGGVGEELKCGGHHEKFSVLHYLSQSLFLIFGETESHYVTPHLDLFSSLGHYLSGLLRDNFLWVSLASVHLTSEALNAFVLDHLFRDVCIADSKAR